MNVLGVGPIELLIIMLVAFLFLGPGRMVEAARSLGKMAREIKRTTGDLHSLVALDEPLDQPSGNEARIRTGEVVSGPREGEPDDR